MFFFNISNNLSITKPRLDRSNSNATVSLDITDIQKLKSLLYLDILKMVYWKLKNLKILMIGLLW